MAPLDTGDFSRDPGGRDRDEHFSIEPLHRERQLEVEPQRLVDDGLERKRGSGLHDGTGDFTDSGRAVKRLIA